jgi:hypothetical protein
MYRDEFNPAYVRAATKIPSIQALQALSGSVLLIKWLKSLAEMNCKSILL